MRKITKMFALATIFIAFNIGLARCNIKAAPDIFADESPACSCTHHKGGCVIDVAAPAGFKCRCKYKGAWTCTGAAFPCVGEDQCPGNLADYCACKQGGGDCGGYRKPVTSCKNSGKPRVSVEGTASCDCWYHWGGCTIAKAAPFGWKCVCVYKGFWTCRGWPQQCAAHEKCLGNDYSYCGCQQGGGDCSGYPDKPKCPSPFFSSSCNCKKAKNWNKGSFTVEKVTYETENSIIQSLNPIVLVKKEIPNNTSEIQSIAFNVQVTLTSTSSFSHTRGINIEKGFTFKLGIPIIDDFSLRISTSFSHTYGQEESMATSYNSMFTCNGAPYRHTICKVTMQKVQKTVPYAMTLKHKIIPNCACKTYGVWTGIQAYHAKLTSQDMGSCSHENCQ